MIDKYISRVVKIQLIIVLSIAILVIAKGFLYPIAIAVLFAYLIFPIASFLERKGLPRILSILISLIFAISVLVLAVLIFYGRLRMLVEGLTGIQNKLVEKALFIRELLNNTFKIESESSHDWLLNSIIGFFESGSSNFGSIFSATTGTIIRVSLLPVFAFFMLLYRDKVRQFFLMVARDKHKEKAVRILDQVSHITQHYMGGVVIVVLILVVVNIIGLKLIGIEYAVALGLIAAVCNIIPYFGTILGFSFPFIFSLLYYDTFQQPMSVAFMFIIVQFTENNILTPTIVGANVRLNPIVIIFSLIAGAMVWGIPGMLVVIPFMAILKVIFENVKSLKPYAFLLGTKGVEKHTVSWHGVKLSFRKWRKKK